MSAKLLIGKLTVKVAWLETVLANEPPDKQKQEPGTKLDCGFLTQGSHYNKHDNSQTHEYLFTKLIVKS